MSFFLRLVLFSSLAVTLSAQDEAGVVSVEELRNPLTGKSLRMVMAAREHLIAGKRERALQELRQAMNDPAAMPYAISFLGFEHLRDGQLDVAFGELEQAIKLLPGRPENRSNLAFLLYLKGQTERGLQEVRKALQLDGGNPQTRLVFGLLLLQQGSQDEEAIRQLRLASEGTPDAHLVLAQHYDRHGQAPEADKERRAYQITSMGFQAAK